MTCGILGEDASVGMIRGHDRLPGVVDEKQQLQAHRPLDALMGLLFR